MGHDNDKSIFGSGILTSKSHVYWDGVPLEYGFRCHTPYELIHKWHKSSIEYIIIIKYLLILNRITSASFPSHSTSPQFNIIRISWTHSVAFHHKKTFQVSAFPSFTAFHGKWLRWWFSTGFVVHVTASLFLISLYIFPLLPLTTATVSSSVADNTVV